MGNLVAESLTDKVVDGSSGSRTKCFLDDLYGAIAAPLKSLNQQNYMWGVIARGLRRGLEFLLTKTITGDSSELTWWQDARKDVQLEVTRAHMNVLKIALQTVNPDKLNIDAATATPEDSSTTISIAT